MRNNRVHSLTEPRNRCIEHGREYTDERSRSESAHLMAHRRQLLGTRTMLLEPPLVFGHFSAARALLFLPTQDSADRVQQSPDNPVRHEQHLTHPALR